MWQRREPSDKKRRTKVDSFTGPQTVTKRGEVSAFPNVGKGSCGREVRESVLPPPQNSPPKAAKKRKRSLMVTGNLGPQRKALLGPGS